MTGETEREKAPRVKAFGLRIRRRTLTWMLLLGGVGMSAIGVFLVASSLHANLAGVALLFAGVLCLFEGLIRTPQISGIEIIGVGETDLDKRRAMLTKADRTILFACGGLSDSLLGAVGDVFEAKLVQGVDISILCGSSTTPGAEWEKRLAGWFGKYPDRFRVYRTKEGPNPHGMLVDGRRLRLEKHLGTDGRESVHFRRATIGATAFLHMFEDSKKDANRRNASRDVIA